MLKWTVVLTVLSAIAGLLGFSDLSTDASGLAKLLFCIFLVTFVAAMLLGLLNSRTPDRQRQP